MLDPLFAATWGMLPQRIIRWMPLAATLVSIALAIVFGWMIADEAGRDVLSALVPCWIAALAASILIWRWSDEDRWLEDIDEDERD